MQYVNHVIAYSRACTKLNYTMYLDVIAIIVFFASIKDYSVLFCVKRVKSFDLFFSMYFLKGMHMQQKLR